jgi:four helix bundle protein
MQDFRKLFVWQKAHALTVRLDEYLPRIASKKPGLADQLGRAADSIPANIAEGCRRETKTDFRRFLSMAIGSISELETHLIRAHAAGLLDTQDFLSLVGATVEIRKMLHGLRKSLS